MTPRFLLPLFDSVYLLALTAWVGSILFFSFGVAPVIFRVLGAEAGGRFVRALFPRYYAWGAVSGAIALPAYLGVPLSFPELRGPMVGVQALGPAGAVASPAGVGPDRRALGGGQHRDTLRVLAHHAGGHVGGVRRRHACQLTAPGRPRWWDAP